MDVVRQKSEVFDEFCIVKCIFPGGNFHNDELTTPLLWILNNEVFQQGENRRQELRRKRVGKSLQ